jgi:hypothetical protein
MVNGYLIFKPNAKGIWMPKVVMGSIVGRPIEGFQYTEIPWSARVGFLIESHSDLGTRILFYDKDRFPMVGPDGSVSCAVISVTPFVNNESSELPKYDIAANVLELNAHEHLEIVSLWNSLIHTLHGPQPSPLPPIIMSMEEWWQLQQLNHQPVMPIPEAQQFSIHEQQYQEFVAQQQAETAHLNTLAHIRGDDATLKLIDNLIIEPVESVPEEGTIEEPELASTPPVADRNKSPDRPPKTPKEDPKKELITAFRKLLSFKPSAAVAEIYDLFEREKNNFQNKNKQYFEEFFDMDFSIQICITLLQARKKKVPINIKQALLWRLVKYKDEDFSNRKITNMSNYIKLTYDIYKKLKKPEEQKNLLRELRNINYRLIATAALKADKSEDNPEIKPSAKIEKVTSYNNEVVQDKQQNYSAEDYVKSATIAIDKMDSSLLNNLLHMDRSGKRLPKIFELLRNFQVNEQQLNSYRQFIAGIDLNLKQISELLSSNPTFDSKLAKDAWVNLVSSKIEDLLKANNAKVIEVLSYENYAFLLKSMNNEKKTLLMLALEHKCTNQKIIDFIVSNCDESILFMDRDGNNALHYWVNSFASEKNSLDPQAKIFAEIYHKFQEESETLIRRKFSKDKDKHVFMHTLMNNKYDISFMHLLLEQDNSPKLVQEVLNIISGKGEAKQSNKNDPNGVIKVLLHKNSGGDNTFTLLENKSAKFSQILDGSEGLVELMIRNAPLLASYANDKAYPIVYDLFNIEGSGNLEKLLEDIADDNEAYQKAKEIIVRRMKLRDELCKKEPNALNELGN